MMNIIFVLAILSQLLCVYDVIGNYYGIALSIIIMPIYIVSNLINKKDFYGTFLGNKKVLFISILCICIGLVRNNHPTTNSIWLIIKPFQLFCLFIGVGIFIKKNRGNFEKIIYINLIPFFILALINFLLWNVGYVPPKIEESFSGDAILLSNIGISASRAIFPFGFGLNNYSMVMGALFIISLISIFTMNKHKLFYIVSALISCISLLYLDTRSTIISSILVITSLVLIRNKSQINFLKVLPYLTIIGPILYASLIPLLINFDLISIIVRDNEELASGNSRFLIWAVAVSELSSFKFEHIFGYGEYGHYASGASIIWAEHFSAYEKDEIKSPHNTVLSIVFDYGYIGLIIYIILLSQIASRIRKVWLHNRGIALTFAGLFFYVILVSISEASFGMYAGQFNYLFFVMVHLIFDAGNVDVVYPIEFSKLKNRVLKLEHV